MTLNNSEMIAVRVRIPVHNWIFQACFLATAYAALKKKTSRNMHIHFYPQLWYMKLMFCIYYTQGLSRTVYCHYMNKQSI